MFVITGQTATGKTSYALDLAKKVNGELVNADSRQIYKYLNVITGKDIPVGCHFEEGGFYTIDGTKLWLYDVVDPKLPFSSYDYKICAQKVIDDIVSRGKTPIIVGGTYLYIKHLLYGFETETIGPDWKLREELNMMPVEKLQEKLRKIDLQSFDQLNNSDKNNPRRLIRRIEIVSYTPEVQVNNTSAVQNTTPTAQTESFLAFRFKTNENLSKAIKKRVEERLERGAIEEVESLLHRGYKKTDPGLQTIGYQQLIAFAQGTLTKDEAIKQWVFAEIHYAKRQYTFIKQDKKVNWRLV